MTAAAKRVEKLYGHLKDTSNDCIGGPNALREERSRASFNTREMTYYLDGGEDVTAFNESIMSELEQHPELYSKSESWYDQSHEQIREHTLARVRRIYHIMLNDQGDAESKRARAALYALYDMDWYIRQGVHFGLFMGAIMGQGDSEQQAKWLPSTMMMEIYGCFAMTELGHGSFLRGLETTATYDRKTQEFIIHSPTDTSTKWWIGAAGETATHTICYAQLLIDGETKGVHNFIIQLRDTNTHEPLPGISIGDCGSKMGLNGIDNGWIQFHHVRIPRENMLCKYAKVAEDGTYSKPPTAQMAYGALIASRGDLVMLSCNMMKKALMISIRYSAIRRQGVSLIDAEGPETKLLDYQSHQHRLMPLLATAYAFHFQVKYVRNLLKRLDTRMMEENAEFDGLLADVHATMAGLKAFGTWTTQSAIEQCRQCCGGHGYSSYNALGGLVADFAVMVTFEGDNTVMAQQTARYLISSYRKMRKGQRLMGSVTYLENPSGRKWKWSAEKPSDLLRASIQLEALRYLAFSHVQSVAVRLEREEARGKTKGQAWNACQVDLIEAARVHVFYNVALHFIAQVDELDDKNGLKCVLGELCNLFALNQLQNDLARFFQDEFISSDQALWIQNAQRELCGIVRKNAVPLVDAFNFTDVVLNSCIGRQDGNIYQSLLQTVSHRTKRTAYFEKLIKPMFDGEFFN